MARTVGIGYQNFEQLIQKNYFYIDKTAFIKEWWEKGDAVTLITRPRRFGKTLTLSMVEQFFSVKFAHQGDLFQKLSIWQEQNYPALQGTYPVISLSFSNVKERDYIAARKKICQLLTDLYTEYTFLLDSGCMEEGDKKFFQRISVTMDDVDATLAIHYLSKYLSRYYKKKVIILLDEYDTPMQEAYVHGYWEELVLFTRSLFHSAFKTNPWLERAIMTGITRVSKESIFSDLNNLKVVTTTSREYETTFGFTEQEVFAAMDEYGMTEKEKEKVKSWYNGFIFGERRDIYNPWSIINFLDTKKFTTYWANTSSNSLIDKLIRESSRTIKESFEYLLKGEHLIVSIDEQIVYNQLDQDENAIWSLLVASGYLKVIQYTDYDFDDGITMPQYWLSLTNYEVNLMFKNMVRGWFSGNLSDYNDFIKALLCNNKKAMNIYMNKVALAFDIGKRPSKEAEPESERFYHGFVLGLIVDLADRYRITSNRESGFGRYDIVLEPYDKKDNAIILEFKVHDPEEEASLQDTVKAALQQIKEKRYASGLEEKGVDGKKILLYGFAFEGKKVLIG